MGISKAPFKCYKRQIKVTFSNTLYRIYNFVTSCNTKEKIKTISF